MIGANDNKGAHDNKSNDNSGTNDRASMYRASEGSPMFACHGRSE